jgi:hypothetical protein
MTTLRTHITSKTSKSQLLSKAALSRHNPIQADSISLATLWPQESTAIATSHEPFEDLLSARYAKVLQSTTSPFDPVKLGISFGFVRTEYTIGFSTNGMQKCVPSTFTSGFMPVIRLKMIAFDPLSTKDVVV